MERGPCQLKAAFRQRRGPGERVVVLDVNRDRRVAEMNDDDGSRSGVAIFRIELAHVRLKDAGLVLQAPNPSLKLRGRWVGQRGHTLSGRSGRLAVRRGFPLRRVQLQPPSPVR